MELRGQDMRYRRILGMVAAFLAMSGSMLGSDPETRRQVRWSELKQLVGGKKVTLQLAEGARLEGRIRKVTAPSLDFKIKKSSDLAAYPKGKMQIPRETVSRIEVRGLKANKGKQVGATVATFVGTLLGSVVVLTGGKVHEGSSNLVMPSSVAIATGAAVLVYRALAPKAITIIEILPDSPGERDREPTNKDLTPSPKQNTSSLEGRESSKALKSLGLDSNS